MELSVNYHGFFDGNFGISEATRLNALALEKAGIQVHKINYSSENFERLTEFFLKRTKIKLIFSISTLIS